MSNQLEKQYALNSVVVQKVITGEVLIHLINPYISNINISNDKPVDLLSLKGVTINELRNSNLKVHVAKGCLILV